MSKLKYAVLILLISSAALLHADGIAKHLDSDGDCYFHVRRKASAQSLHPADQSRYRQVFQSILTDAGFDSLGGFGASSIRLDNGYCRHTGRHQGTGVDFPGRQHRRRTLAD